MIRWTKGGKVDREWMYQSDDASDMEQWADALDIAVEALRELALHESWQMSDGPATNALRQIGAEQ